MIENNASQYPPSQIDLSMLLVFSPAYSIQQVCQQFEKWEYHYSAIMGG